LAIGRRSPWRSLSGPCPDDLNRTRSPSRPTPAGRGQLRTRFVRRSKVDLFIFFFCIPTYSHTPCGSTPPCWPGFFPPCLSLFRPHLFLYWARGLGICLICATALDQRLPLFTRNPDTSRPWRSYLKLERPVVVEVGSQRALRAVREIPKGGYEAVYVFSGRMTPFPSSFRLPRGRVALLMFVRKTRGFPEVFSTTKSRSPVTP